LQKDPQLAKHMAKDNMTSTDTVLEVNDLHTYFFNRRGITKAVDYDWKNVLAYQHSKICRLA